LTSRILILAALACPLFAAEPLSTFYDSELSRTEREVTRLAEAMPAGKYNFAPTNGTFNGVRTFASQVKHIATYTYQLASSDLGEKPPVDIGKDDNGPDSLQTKEQILAYLKGAFAMAHRSVAKLTPENQMEQVKSLYGERTRPRVAIMSMYNWHSFDHYGQMVVYARMNGVVPGQAPPAASASKR
jgi:hypothetical protein